MGLSFPSTAAIILAAGQSRRMGRPKMTLPWGETTVIGQVTRVLCQAGALPVIVVTGPTEEDIRIALAASPVIIVPNTNYLEGDMLVSLQRGLVALPEGVEAVLVALGDQPQIDQAVVEQVIRRFRESGAGLVVPSYQLRRGHPWLMGKKFWPEVLEMGGDQSLRDFLNRHSQEINYVETTTSSILKDLDTPEAYSAQKPV